MNIIKKQNQTKTGINKEKGPYCLLKKYKFFEVLANFQQILHTKRSQIKSMHANVKLQIFAPCVYEHLQHFGSALGLRFFTKIRTDINTRSLTFTYMIVASPQLTKYEHHYSKTPKRLVLTFLKLVVFTLHQKHMRFRMWNPCIDTCILHDILPTLIDRVVYQHNST